MRSRATLFSFFITIGFLALPLAAHAAVPFFGPIIPQGISFIGDSQTCPLGWSAVIFIINNIISFLITIGIVFVAPIMIASAGFLYVVNPMNPSGMSKARDILKNTVAGIVIALAAWLIVAALMAVLYNPREVGSTWANLIISGGFDPCIQQKGSLSTDTLNQATVSPFTTSQSSSSGGVCTIQNSGSCAPSNLSLFGGAANQASVICSAESANGVLLQGDRTTDGIPVSFGLFQINITAHPIGNLNCPSAFDSVFTGSHKNVKIKNTAEAQTLYNACKQAALTPSVNIQKAYDIYRSSGYRWSQWSAASRCSLVFEEIPAVGRLCALLSSYD